MPEASQDLNRKPHHPNHFRSFSLYSPKLSILLLASCIILFTLHQIQSIHTPSSPPSWPLTMMNQWQKVTNCTQELKSVSLLQRLITFLPLKDMRYADKALQGHTWFMSSMYDTQKEGEVQYQQFPSESSNGMLLCLKGNDTHDGSWNSYALAWPEALPFNATLMKGLTFVSYNHYSYDNIWHGLSALVPFVAWHIRNECEVPKRWILYVT